MMTEKVQFDKIISNVPDVMKYKDAGSRIPLLREVLDAAGAPDKQFKTIHICGTNGKGSTSGMIYGLLQGAGFKTGFFSSPPMYDDREQIQFDGQLVSYSQFNESYQELEIAFEKIHLNQTDFSMFETWYLVSAIFFAKMQADYVVYECGLGGEFDATNATRGVEYAIFTKVAMDHMNILGSTIEEIATTKSKIIKPGIKVICHPKQASKVTQILRDEAEKQKAEFYQNGSYSVAMEEEHLTYSVVSLLFKKVQVTDQYFNLGGIYQISNLQNVLNWIEVFNQNSSNKISLDNLKKVLEEESLPGRMEAIQKDPLTMIDGAHNINAINGLVDTIEQQQLSKRLIFVIGFLADKQYQKCIDRLLDLPATFIITSPDNEKRALPADELYQIFKDDPKSRQRELILADSISTAVDTAKKLQEQSKAILIFTGSFYLVNKISPLWNEN